MSTQSAHSSFSFTYLKVFLLLIFFLVLGALTVRGITLYKERSFTANSFNLLVHSEEKAFLYILEQSPKKLSIIELEHYLMRIDPQDRMASSIVLGIPIHGIVFSREIDDYSLENAKDFFRVSNVIEAFFVPGKYAMNNFNYFDFFIFWLSTGGVDDDSFFLESLDLRKDDFELSNLSLQNDTVFNQKVSVEVVNATDVNRLGKYVADMLLASGFNVVSVVGGENRVVSSIQYKSDIAEETDMLLFQLFDIPSQIDLSENAVSDVQIVIGSDIGKRVEEMIFRFLNDTIDIK